MAATVTVGCKLPHGLHMDLGDKRVTINGTNSAAIIGGHGITEGVDADFFDAWMKKNKDLPFVQRGLIFASEKKADIKAQAVEKKDVKTGLERLDPKKAPKGIKKVEKSDNE